MFISATKSSRTLPMLSLSDSLRPEDQIGVRCAFRVLVLFPFPVQVLRDRAVLLLDHLLVVLLLEPFGDVQRQAFHPLLLFLLRQLLVAQVLRQLGVDVCLEGLVLLLVPLSHHQNEADLAVGLGGFLEQLKRR